MNYSFNTLVESYRQKGIIDNHFSTCSLIIYLFSRLFVYDDDYLMFEKCVSMCHVKKPSSGQLNSK